MNASDDGNNNPSQNQNNPLENEQRKKGKGRQKITMAKIENETNLQVTFSKRRAGVFKKASELSTLCGAESAVVVFSPGNKPHSFGHPNVETVANRFLHANAAAEAPPRANAADQLIVAHGEAAMHQRNQELVALEAELERERRRKKKLDGLNSGGHAPPQLDELDYEELDRLRKSVLGFKHEFEAKVKNVGSSSHWGGDGAGVGAGAGAGASTAVDSSDHHHHHHHLGFPGYGYGGSSINHNAANPSIGSSYGYTVQYPPVAAGGSHGMTPYNYGADPAAVVEYDAVTDADADAGREAARPDDINKFQGFGASSRRPGF